MRYAPRGDPAGSSSSLDHVVKCNVYLRDINHFAAMNEVYEGVFSALFPASTPLPSMSIWTCSSATSRGCRSNVARGVSSSGRT